MKVRMCKDKESCAKDIGPMEPLEKEEVEDSDKSFRIFTRA